MRRIALDTNAYVAFKRGDEGAIEIIRHADRIAMSSVVLGELLAGFACGNRVARNRRELSAFLDSPRVQLLGIGPTTADYYARIFAALRSRGQPVPTNDLWVAASALEEGCALFTYDRHFDVIENLPTGRTLDDFLPL